MCEPLLPKKPVIDDCFIWNFMFQKNQRQFQVQNVLFIAPASAVCIKEWFNSFESSMVFGITHYLFKIKIFSLFFLTTVAATHTIITQLICAGSATCGKSMVYRCIRTEVDIFFWHLAIPIPCCRHHKGKSFYQHCIKNLAQSMVCSTPVFIHNILRVKYSAKHRCTHRSLSHSYDRSSV